MKRGSCRRCGAPLDRAFLDLGHAPASNAYLREAALDEPEVTYPLRLKVCDDCHLVQTDDFAEAASLFSADYAYFSSISQGWLDHAARYARMIAKRFGLGGESQMIEVASNDGYLLWNFVAAGIPCLGVEPTDSTAGAAEALGIPVIRSFFGESLGLNLAQEGRGADLVVGTK